MSAARRPPTLILYGTVQSKTADVARFELTSLEVTNQNPVVSINEVAYKDV